jgi:hypothetical protein
MTQTRLVIGTACFGGQVTSDFAMSLLRLQAAGVQRNVDIAYIFSSGDALITRARNEIVAAFLDDAKATHLLFIDADIVFDPAAVLRLLDFGRPFVAGIYPAKLIQWDTVREKVKQGIEPLEAASLRYVYMLESADKRGDPIDGFARARWAGTGFMMIERSVLVRLAEAHPELAYAGVHSIPDTLAGSKNRYALFDPMIDPDSRVYLSEDYAFCQRWRALGGEIWVDLTSRLTHIGPRAFVGDASAQFLPPPDRSE